MEKKFSVLAAILALIEQHKLIAEGAGLVQEGTVITPSGSNDQPAQ